MRDLIYLSLPWLSRYDPALQEPDYQHHKWFGLKNIEHWPPHTTSRVHALDTPWSLAPTVSPIPAITHNDLDFGRVMDSIAAEFCEQAQQSNRSIYVCWSGGIDSTTILVSLLKNASPEFLRNITVLHSAESIKENSYFFSRFIHNKLSTQDIDQFRVTAENHDKIMIVDGEGGNQCMGQNIIHKLIYAGRLDVLNQSWSKTDPGQLLLGTTEFGMRLVTESIAHAPIPIETGCDFVWWANFNFKWDDVLLRKALDYTRNLDANQSQQFYEQGLYRFYAHPRMQIWSMLAKDMRRESSKYMPKYIPKRYIFDFDKNEYYFNNKSEEGSSSQVFFNQDVGSETTPIFAIDQHWNKYSIADPAVRKQLGTILQRG